MLTLENFNAKAATREVALSADLKVTVRVLRTRELNEIADIYVRPVAPYGKDPLKGSDAPSIQREDDVGYQRRLRRWYGDLRTAEIAVSIDLGVALDGGTDKMLYGACPAGRREAWLAEAVSQLQDVFTEPQLRMLAETMRTLSTVGLVKEAIKVLIVERDGKDRPVDDENAIAIPQDYDTSETGLLMSAAARYGRDPLPWIRELPAADKAIILAKELIEQQKESHRTALAAAALRVASF